MPKNRCEMIGSFSQRMRSFTSRLAWMPNNICATNYFPSGRLSPPYSPVQNFLNCAFSRDPMLRLRLPDSAPKFRGGSWELLGGLETSILTKFE